MHPDTSTTSAQRRSPFLAAFGIILAGVAFVAWLQSGHVSALLGALAFVAMAPVWYLLPISFTEPIQGQWKHLPKQLPKWAQVLTVVGLVLLFASVALRWAA
jgi:hypothetical protein